MRLVPGVSSPESEDGPEAAIPADLDAAHAPLAGNGDLLDAVQKFVADNEESPEFEAIGAYLGDLLLRDDVAAQWDSLRKEHANELHVLLDIQPKSLRAVPWELLVRDERRLFLDEGAVLARVKELHDDVEQQLVPLRLLVVEGQQDDEGDPLGAVDEMRGIKSALPGFRGRIDAEFLHQPTREEFLDAFKRVRPHIFHFMGHGMVGARGELALRMGGWSLTRRFILDTLSHMPRVVILNACRSGKEARAGSLTATQVRTLTDTFLANGSAAAIGMQGDVRGGAAAEFGAGLYGALAEGQLLDQAVARARRLMVQRGGNDLSRDWCLPSLTLSVAPEQVLPLVCGISEVEQKRVESELFRPIGLFVDRSPIRWDLAAATDPDDGVGDPARLVLIVGDSEAGKTWLVNWIRTRCAFRGRRVRYVDFTDKDGVRNFVRALELIRDAPEDIPSLAEPADGAFDRFTWDLAHLANGQIPPELMAGDPPEIPDPPLLGGDCEERIFESFRTALEEATADDPLLIILDHVDGILKPDFQGRIFQHFVKPVINENPPNVRLIVVLSTKERSSHWPSDEGDVGMTVTVKLLSEEDYRSCAEDVVLAMGKEFNDLHAQAIELIKQLRPFPISPGILKTLEELVGGG